MSAFPSRSTILCSIRGYGHILRERPNQDALAIQENHDRKSVAICDGHGARGSFRSHIGSKITAEVAVELLQRQTSLNQEVSDDILKALHHSWNQEVQSHLEQHPFHELELEKLDPRFPPKQQKKVAYGSTLLACSEDASGLHFLQVGDGDILTLDANGDIQRPIPCDPRHDGRNTTSICSNQPLADFRWHSSSPSDKVDMIFMATDGYLNSYCHEDDFFNVVRDLQRIYRNEGRAYLEKHLERWLQETSKDGSEDDITVALMFRKN